MGCTLSAQPHYAQVLATLEQNSPSLHLLQQQREAQQAAVRAGSLVEDPEVEFAYLWRSPGDAQGNRWDLKVMQSFEMPSVYAHKNKIRQLQQVSADCSWRQQRQQLLFEAQQVCAALVYYNAYVDFYTQCERSAQDLADLYQARLQNGDCGVLDYNRIQLQLAETQNKLNVAKVQRDAMADNLALLNGGSLITFEQLDFEPLQLPADFDQWIIEMEERSPQLHYLLNQVQQSQQQLRLSRSQWLPKVALGYASEHTVPESFRGVALGLNIPLWSKARTVTHAKVELQSAQLEHQNALLHYHNHLKILFNKVKALDDNYKNLQQTLALYNSEELLAKALQAGEISLEYYLRSIEFYRDTKASLLEVAYELEQAYLQLNADAL